jgi:hypothetical protein
MTDDPKPRLSGWCTGPPGARVDCKHCRWDLCEHHCHTERKDTE